VWLKGFYKLKNITDVLKSVKYWDIKVKIEGVTHIVRIKIWI
jgi:hypothetical protein